jgi:hypothetical protein
MDADEIIRYCAKSGYEEVRISTRDESFFFVSTSEPSEMISSNKSLAECQYRYKNIRINGNKAHTKFGGMQALENRCKICVAYVTHK